MTYKLVADLVLAQKLGVCDCSGGRGTGKSAPMAVYRKCVLALYLHLHPDKGRAFSLDFFMDYFYWRTQAILLLSSIHDLVKVFTL